MIESVISDTEKSTLLEEAPPSCTVTPPKSVKIIDADEIFLFDDPEELIRALGCPPGAKVKILAIVGNTGDGKSYTLNRAFCPDGAGDGSEEVFTTSPAQSTCTMGVWAAYEPRRGYLLLDTEGLLGASANPNRQRRLLLKVFAVADVVVYRSVADRLHNDMFAFLADASDAFGQHFAPALARLARDYDLPYSTRQLGPAVVIFHETRHTQPLPPDQEGAAFLADRLKGIHRNVDAFSTLRYVGIQTESGPTDFESLVREVESLMAESLVRSARGLEAVVAALAGLSAHFGGALPDAAAEAAAGRSFVAQFFACPAACAVCAARCSLGVGHPTSATDHHHSAAPCVYSQQHQNKVYYCKRCYAEGRRVVLMPKTLDEGSVGGSGGGSSLLGGVVRYLWYGYALRCPQHGLLYQARAHWSGNPPPEDSPRVHWEVTHLWPGQTSLLKGTHPFGQLVVDGLTSVSEQVSALTAPPTRLIGDLIADSLAPDYWQPNASITHCSCCAFAFPTTTTPPDPPSVDSTVGDDVEKHHCRACGRGVCASCSRNRIPVPERGYHSEAVRVCDRCFSARTEPSAPSSSASSSNSVGEQSPPTTSSYGRKILETLSATASLLAPVYSAPKQLVKESVRPWYWEADEACVRCARCGGAFGARRRVHHCRACGRGVCGGCSRRSAPVPRRAIHWPVRVCDACFADPAALAAPSEQQR